MPYDEKTVLCSSFQTSKPPSMHRKLTEHGRSCMLNNQLPTESSTELYITLINSKGIIMTWVEIPRRHDINCFVADHGVVIFVVQSCYLWAWLNFCCYDLYLRQSAKVISYLSGSFNFFFWELTGKARWQDWNGSRHAVVCALIGNFRGCPSRWPLTSLSNSLVRLSSHHHLIWLPCLTQDHKPLNSHINTDFILIWSN